LDEGELRYKLLQSKLLMQAVGSLPDFSGNEINSFDYVAATLHGIAPKDSLEGMIGVQMVAVHAFAMECMRRDPNSALRCGARTRRGTKCQAPMMLNGRCRMHGGGSTGPRTPEGLARSRRANWKHGLYSAQAKAERRLLRKLLTQSCELLEQVDF